MKDEQSQQRGGVAISSGGDITIGGDVVGGNKIVNIIQAQYKRGASKITALKCLTTGQSLITAKAANAFEIESDFLRWSQCTIMLWLFVPPKGRRLRDSPHNCYILAHNTGKVDEEIYFNQFGFRHCSGRGRMGRWEIQFSNNQAEYPERYLTATDGLKRGWHHFLIAWDDEVRRKLTLVIDLGKGGGSVSKSYLPYWPEKLAETVCVGAWDPGDWEGYYCETRLFQLWILDHYLELTDKLVTKHFALKPRAGARKGRKA